MEINLVLKKISHKHPEKYEVYSGFELVGCIELRHGKLKVYFPSKKGKKIYEHFFGCGKGEFEDEEEKREYLSICKQEIAKSLKKDYILNKQVSLSISKGVLEDVDLALEIENKFYSLLDEVIEDMQFFINKKTEKK